jgi:hypothetical protein
MERHNGMTRKDNPVTMALQEIDDSSTALLLNVDFVGSSDRRIYPVINNYSTGLCFARVGNVLTLAFSAQPEPSVSH